MIEVPINTAVAKNNGTRFKCESLITGFVTFYKINRAILKGQILESTFKVPLHF